MCAIEKRMADVLDRMRHATLLMSTRPRNRWWLYRPGEPLEPMSTAAVERLWRTFRVLPCSRTLELQGMDYFVFERREPLLPGPTRRRPRRAGSEDG